MRRAGDRAGAQREREEDGGGEEAWLRLLTMAIDRDTGESFRLWPTPELSADKDDWWARACRHPNVRVVTRVTADERIQIRKQCLICGELRGGAVKRANVPADVPPEDKDLRARYQQARREEWESIEQKHIRKQKAHEADWWENYDRYLASPQWALVREKVLKRANRICEGCLERPASEVHHLTYAHVENELIFELVALCKPCHARLHPPEEDQGLD